MKNKSHLIKTTKEELEAVQEFWEDGSCGEVLGKSEEEGSKALYDTQSRVRYELEPYIHDFANFNYAFNKDVLEIGVGMGADHQNLARTARTLPSLKKFAETIPDIHRKCIAHVQLLLNILNHTSNQKGIPKRLSVKIKCFSGVFYLHK